MYFRRIPIEFFFEEHFEVSFYYLFRRVNNVRFIKKVVVKYIISCWVDIVHFGVKDCFYSVIFTHNILVQLPKIRGNMLSIIKWDLSQIELKEGCISSRFGNQAERSQKEMKLSRTKVFPKKLNIMTTEVCVSESRQCTPTFMR